MKLSEYVHSYRKTHRLSLRTMAERCSTSFQYLSKLEKGEITNPSIETIAKIATGMGMTIDDLLSSVDDMWVSLPSGKSEPKVVLTDAELKLRDRIRDELCETIKKATLSMSVDEVEHLDEIIRVLCKNHIL